MNSWIWWRKSKLVDELRLNAHLDNLKGRNELPADPAQLAEMLVRDGLLTRFQAEQILLGKWRKFTIGKYRVLERLGSGGMGNVYLCEHPLMRRRVAVKVLPTARASDPAALERFYLEARAVAALDHPNIVRAHDVDQDDQLYFLVMEHVDGSNLQEIVKISGPLDPIRAAHYMRQAAFGLQHAHEFAGLVHRDIKPGNILVDRNGIVKILDMGLARFFDETEEDLIARGEDSILGTADYLAPEQAIDSSDVDIRADIYSLGATFYFLLTGRTLFTEGTVSQKLIWHQTRKPKALRSIRPDLPADLVAVVDRMMAKDKNQRYQTPAEVAEALTPWTQTAIAPPLDAEMPSHSLAARSGQLEQRPCAAGMLNSATPAGGMRRVSWQVNGVTPPSQPPPSASMARQAQPRLRVASLPPPLPVKSRADDEERPILDVRAVDTSESVAKLDTMPETRKRKRTEPSSGRRRIMWIVLLTVSLISICACLILLLSRS